MQRPALRGHVSTRTLQARRERDNKLTCLARVPARDLRARLLVVDEPLLEAAHDAAAVVEGRLSPRLLRVVRVRDFLRNLCRGIGDDGVEVVCRSGVVRGEVLASLEG